MIATELPLKGRTVLVTRPRHQQSDFADRLVELGAQVIAMPAIEIEDLESYDDFDDALGRLETFDWVVFTSVNGVAAVTSGLDRLHIPRSTLAGRKLAAIGPATAAALAEACREPDLVPAEYVAEALDRELPNAEGQKILLARADIARRDLAISLVARGALVEEVAVYRIVPASPPADLPLESPDFIALTSSASALRTRDLLVNCGRGHWLLHSKVVCIGPITEGTVREMGVEVAATAKDYTIPGLIRAMTELANE
jgi:uroporphyrinogen-III synthase